MLKMRVENQCAKPPFGLVWQVQRSLRWICQTDIAGVAFLRLMDEIPVATSGREVGRVHGFYRFETDNEPPYIMLSVREIYKGLPSILWWSTVPALRITRALAHEIGHHLVATKGYVYEPGDAENNEELIADVYAKNVLENMTKQWPYKLGHWCIRDLAGWHYAFGLADARIKKYESAADHFFTAWDLNPDLEAAADGYWRAKELSTNTQNEPS